MTQMVKMAINYLYLVATVVDKSAPKACIYNPWIPWSLKHIIAERALLQYLQKI